MKVCVDAGHGMPDPGAIGPSGRQEADVTLVVAKAMQTALQKSGHLVVLTRNGSKALNDSKSIDLSQRVAVANNVDADCFVSIHCNSATDPSAGGFEVFHAPGSSQGARLAVAILTAAQAAGLVQGGISAKQKPAASYRLRNRGVKQAAHYVTKRTKAPAALIELAFISNVAEEALLQDEAWVAKMTVAIVAGTNAWSERV